MAGLALGFDFAAVMVDDEKAGNQINAVFGRHAVTHDKRIEDDTQRLLRQARPVVADLNDDFRFGPGILQFRRQGDAAAGGQHVQFVLQ